jgi:hypothetical protein
MNEKPSKFIRAVKAGKDACKIGSAKAIKLFKQGKAHGIALEKEYKLKERSEEVVEYATKVTESAEVYYGAVRQKIKTHTLTDTPKALLTATRDELLYIIACVLQISPAGAAKWADRFGKALTAKMAAAGVTTSILGLVATFGTAGTGAAISGLSGAAATSATLAWVGGLIGGGMAAGTFLTAGVGLVVGYAAYKVIGSNARPFDELTELDKGVVETCGVLVAAIDQTLDESEEIVFSKKEAQGFLNNTMLPLEANLRDNAEDICSRLDAKNAIAFRQHALTDFRRVAIQGFGEFIESSHRVGEARPLLPEAIIGGVFYALLSLTAVGDDAESQLVLDALRRSDADLAGVAEAEISDYLAGYSAEQLKGIANNVKGIYHELLYVEQNNDSNEDTFAEVFGATNHPGADIQIKDTETGEVLKEIQLKATGSASYLREHQDKYPDIEIRATEEISEFNDGVVSSGISNATITTQVEGDIESLADNTITDQVIESAGLIGVIVAGKEAIEVLQGEKPPGEAARKTVEVMSVGAATTAITAFLFG